MDRFLDEAPRRLARIQQGLATGEPGGPDGPGAVTDALALAAAAEALGAPVLAVQAEHLAHALQADDPAARERAALTADALRDVADALRDARATGWPAG